MGKSSITVMVCDRCGGVEECRRIEQEYGWGRIVAAQANGPFRIGTPTQKVVFPDGAKDICPDCITALQKWWGQFKTHHTKGASTDD